MLGDTWFLDLGHGHERETQWDKSVVRKTRILSLLSGPSLILKKRCLHKAGLGYTPLVEVNQAITAWSY